MMESPTTKSIQDIEATALKTWMEQEEAILIDVREPLEYATEHIPGARLLPLSTFDPTQVLQEAGKKVVLHCVMGMRSARQGRSCSTPVLRASTISVEVYKRGRMPGMQRHTANGHL